MVWTAHNLPPTQTVATHYNKAFMFGQHAANLTWQGYVRDCFFSYFPESTLS